MKARHLIQEMRWLPSCERAAGKTSQHTRGPEKGGDNTAATTRTSGFSSSVRNRATPASSAGLRGFCVAMDDGGDLVRVESKEVVEVDAAALAKATALKDAGNEFFKSTW
jgi:hypothetical protein